MKKSFVCAVVGLAFAVGCKDERTSTGSTPGAATGTPAAPASPATGASSAAKPAEHARVPIGEKTVGGLKLVATQDAPIRAGSEGAFDVVITGGKPKAVRFWVGQENAEGSVKAKAAEEGTDNWHTHVEVPSSLPPGSKFWVEVEPPAGPTFKAGFDPRT